MTCPCARYALPGHRVQLLASCRVQSGTRPEAAALSVKLGWCMCVWDLGVLLLFMENSCLQPLLRMTKAGTAASHTLLLRARDCLPEEHICQRGTVCRVVKQQLTYENIVRRMALMCKAVDCRGCCL